MAYDINAALRPLDALGAISSGQQAAQGFQTLRNNAQTMRSRAAMARALQGDRNAMADVQDPEMLAKLQEHFRQQDIREGIKGFYNTYDQDRIGVNNLATLASAKPKGFDLAGATQYAMSQGAFEEAKPLMELAKLSKANDKYGNTLMPAYDDAGNLVYIQPGGESGARQISGFRPAETLIQVDQGGNRLLVGGKTGKKVSDYPVSVDPSAVYAGAQQAARQERGAVLDVVTEAEKERIRLQNAAELERRKAQGQNTAAREEKITKDVMDAQGAMSLLGPMRSALKELPSPARMRIESVKSWAGYGNPRIEKALGTIEQIGGAMLKYVERLPGAATDGDRIIFMASSGVLRDNNAAPATRIAAADSAMDAYERLVKKYGMSSIQQSATYGRNPVAIPAGVPQGWKVEVRK